MAKLSQPVKANPKAHEEETPLPPALRNMPKSEDEEDGDEGSAPSAESDVPEKRRRDYEITDEKALYNFNPHLFKLTPNYKKITQALKLGFVLPGVSSHGIDDDGVVEDVSDNEPVKRL